MWLVRVVMTKVMTSRPSGRRPSASQPAKTPTTPIGRRPARVGSSDDGHSNEMTIGQSQESRYPVDAQALGQRYAAVGNEEATTFRDCRLDPLRSCRHFAVRLGLLVAMWCQVAL